MYYVKKTVFISRDDAYLNYRISMDSHAIVSSDQYSDLSLEDVLVMIQNNIKALSALDTVMVVKPTNDSKEQTLSLSDDEGKYKLSFASKGQEEKYEEFNDLQKLIESVESILHA